MARVGTYPAHKEKHQDGGPDEINVGSLSGDLADTQDAKAHTAASHSDIASTGAAIDAAVAASHAAAHIAASHSDIASTGAEIDAAVAKQAGVALECTLAMYQANAATGTAQNPDDINDNNPASVMLAEPAGEYSEVDFGIVVCIRTWRIYGSNLNNEDGVWKIQYYNLATHAWADWVTGIATNKAVWTAPSVESEVITDKIRLVCVTVDSVGISRCGELEVYY